MPNRILTVAKKELWSYFSSPTAYIFLGTYLFVSLFAFFWVEKFFSRNIADLRPLFEWMPILLIFLISTLTMKMWSEERRVGTIEFLLTLPAKTYELVMGKFIACLSLVGVALALTLGLAVSVGFLGNVDWGPVIGAYFASLLLASAYIAVGLYISSKNDSQIVSLILTCLICSLFYLIGADKLVSLFGNQTSELMKLLGSGSRFDSISRGVIDFRDVYYYVSVAAAFLVANTFALDKLKWSRTSHAQSHFAANVVTALLFANIIGANFWLHKIGGLRADLTQNKMYTISAVTKDLVRGLEEPLLIRGYFSSQTHPLLAPWVPTVRDILNEYQFISNGKILAEFVDPRDDEEIEAEANRKYNIEPIPFQIRDRHSASMVNSYFNIVVQYGDQFEVLNFDDLIEIKYDGMGDIDVRLRNLEYDLTRSIKKAVQAFKNNDNLFASLKRPVKFVGYVSEKGLPKELDSLYGELKKALDEYKKQAGDKLSVEFKDPSADRKLAQHIAQSYGFKPQALSIMAQNTFYFYLTVVDGEKVYNLGVPKDLSVDAFRTSMDSALRRVVPGFMKTVGIFAPQGASNPMMARFGGGGAGKQFRLLQKKLEENYTTQRVNLAEGTVPSELDLLVVLAPENLDSKASFAIDQFLMKGGTVVLATSPVSIQRSQREFVAKSIKSGLEEWLGHHGIVIPEKLVGDRSNIGFPAVRKRVVSGITIREPYVAPYPFFIDVRGGLNQKQAITSSLGELAVAWPSPIELDREQNKERVITELVKSSAQSWVTDDINIEPNRQLYPELGFYVPDQFSPSTLAVMIEGRFTSFFTGKESPLLAKLDESSGKDKSAGASKGAQKDEDSQETLVTSVIEKSTKGARLVVIASNEFAADETLQVAGMLDGTQYIAPIQFTENTIDWSIQDRALLAIRSRGHFARTLLPLSNYDKHFWEVLNYVLALFGLVLVWGIFRYRKRSAGKRFESLKIA